MQRSKKPTIYTIGHSTRGAEEFIEILKAHGVEQLIDIRTIPKSRFNPQFNSETLRESLENEGLVYLHLKELGGLRHAKPDSPNMGWRNASFRGYADYMQTSEFEAGLQHLEELAREKPTAIMCAEAVPWRCHRSLVADALTRDKWRVLHITSRTGESEHKRTSFSRIRKGKLIYPVISDQLSVISKK